jgi:hypothetical protein
MVVDPAALVDTGMTGLLVYLVWTRLDAFGPKLAAVRTELGELRADLAVLLDRRHREESVELDRRRGQEDPT